MIRDLDSGLNYMCYFQELLQVTISASSLQRYRQLENTQKTLISGFKKIIAYVASKYFKMEFLLILSSNKHLVFHEFDSSSLIKQES